MFSVIYDLLELYLLCFAISVLTKIYSHEKFWLYENTLSFALLLLPFIGDVFSSIFLFLFIPIVISTFDIKIATKDITKISHCLLKISLAENIDLSGIINTGGWIITFHSKKNSLTQNIAGCETSPFLLLWVFQLFLSKDMNYTLAILVKCQNVLTMIGAELAICANIFLQFLRNTQPGHGKTFPSYIQKALF